MGLYKNHAGYQKYIVLVVKQKLNPDFEFIG